MGSVSGRLSLRWGRTIQMNATNARATTSAEASTAMRAQLGTRYGLDTSSTVSPKRSTVPTPMGRDSPLMHSSSTHVPLAESRSWMM